MKIFQSFFEFFEFDIKIFIRKKKKKIHDKKYVYNRYVLIQYISPRNLNRFP